MTYHSSRRASCAAVHDATTGLALKVSGHGGRVSPTPAGREFIRRRPAGEKLIEHAVRAGADWLRASLAAAMTDLPLNAWLVPLVAALGAAGLAIFVLLRPWAETFHRRVALALGLTALVEVAGAARPVPAFRCRILPPGGAVVRVPAHGGDLPGGGRAHRAIGCRGRAGREAALRDRGRRGCARGGRGVVGCLRGDRRDGRGGGARAARADRAAAPRGDAARAGARTRAARVGAAREPRSLPLPDQVRDPGALRARGLRAVRDVADAAARGLAGAPRARLGHRHARLGGARGARARPDAARAHARAGLGVVAGALRVLHAARRGALPARGGAARRGAAALGPHAERGRDRACGLRGDAGARRGDLVPRRARALPGSRVAPLAALALRLPHQVARGDGCVPRRRVGRAGARPPARRAGPHLRGAAAVRSSCTTRPTTASTRCAR